MADRFETLVQFPDIDKLIRLGREALVQYSRERLAPVPVWKLLKPGQPVSTFPLETELPPTVDFVDVTTATDEELELSSRQKRRAYPEPPEELRNLILNKTQVNIFGEAEHDQREYLAFLAFGLVDEKQDISLTRFGTVHKHDGTLWICRWLLEEIGYLPESGDLFLFRRQLREVLDYKESRRIGGTDYWTWLEVPYNDWHGDSSNLELPDLPANVFPEPVEG
ncbi:hypothetical protein LCGC14_0583780 [marine sediment metagenome]|uniref:Uncharacterized protein n=1 Tax=marine sediment metagenome TaxID=412755 RepID=A0A0F9RZC2_9ZZZZ